jgi:hypothetical protein
MLTLPAKDWIHRSAADYANPALNLSDGRFVTYDQLKAESGERYANVATGEELERKASACQSALDRLADALEAAAPDVAVIVGDDQQELFGPENQPLIAIYYGEEALTSNAYSGADVPEWVRTVGVGYLMDDVHALPCAPHLAQAVIEGLVGRNVDVATCARLRQGSKAAFGHAFGFIVKRLFRGRRIPIVPVLLNTYYPPNVPSSARCHDIGRALRQAIEAYPPDLRVAVIASGGLSHFVVDETLDRSVLAGLATHGESLRDLPREALNSGSSEILNWILAAGAVEHLPLAWTEYQPIYRTPAGTGVGVAAAIWTDRRTEG